MTAAGSAFREVLNATGAPERRRNREHDGTRSTTRSTRSAFRDMIIP
jgi:hypothetical protein